MRICAHARRSAVSVELMWDWKMTEIEAIIEEIRQSRRQMSEQCGHDPTAYIEYLKRFNEKYSIQVEEYHKAYPAPPTEVASIGNRRRRERDG